MTFDNSITGMLTSEKFIKKVSRGRGRENETITIKQIYTTVLLLDHCVVNDYIFEMS